MTAKNTTHDTTLCDAGSSEKKLRSLLFSFLLHYYFVLHKNSFLFSTTMTRGLYPPETLSEDDVRTLRVVRRDIYTNGIVGGGESVHFCFCAVLEFSFCNKVVVVFYNVQGK
jgi:hypothetical protein